MTNFIYKGDTSCHFSIIVNGQIKEFSLFKNHEYELPENDPFIKILIGRMLLKEIKVEKKSFKKFNLK